eukprot:4007809-Pleurochrysis_carterae.AAC.2
MHCTRSCLVADYHLPGRPPTNEIPMCGWLGVAFKFCVILVRKYHNRAAVLAIRNACTAQPPFCHSRPQAADQGMGTLFGWIRYASPLACFKGHTACTKPYWVLQPNCSLRALAAA